MNTKRDFGKFVYFANGVISTVKGFQNQKDPWSKHMDKLNGTTALKEGQATKKLRAGGPSSKIRDGHHTIDVVYLRTLEAGVTRFWRGKMDYVHTG